MKSQKLKRFIIILLVLFALGLLIWWLIVKKLPSADDMGSPPVIKQQVNNDQSHHHDNETEQPPQFDMSANKKINDTQTTGLENLPKSLQGTQVDGEIIIDEQQRLVVTKGLRRLFDYFLSAMGEESEQTIHARVQAYINSHTPKPAANQAIKLYQAYIRYLKELKKIDAKHGHLQMQATAGTLDIKRIGQRQQQVKSLRQRFFNQDTINAFFSDDDVLEDYAIAMLQINQNNNLTEQQKKQRQQLYISRMPNGEQKQHLQNYITQQNNIAQLLETTQKMKAQAATATELYAMREQLVGKQAAQRLAEMDRQDADFDQRFEQYQSQKQAIIEQYGSENDRQAVHDIEQLTHQLFTKTEAKRLEGYAKFKQIQQ